MANMFNKSTEIGGSFKANEMVLSFAGFGAGYLITSVSANFQVAITRLRELGSTRSYYIEGDSSGTMQLGQVVGPASSIVPLVRAYSDVCGISSNVIRLSYSPGACAAFGGSAPDLSLSGAVINNYSIQSQSQGAMTTTASMSGIFEAVETDDSGGGLAGALNNAGNIAAAANI